MADNKDKMELKSEMELLLAKSIEGLKESSKVSDRYIEKFLVVKYLSDDEKILLKDGLSTKESVLDKRLILLRRKETSMVNYLSRKIKEVLSQH